MTNKITAMLPLLRSSNIHTVYKCLNDLYKLPSISARELKESGIFSCVQNLSSSNNNHIRHAAQKLIKRWYTLVAAYEQSELLDKHPESMISGCSSNSQRSPMPVSREDHVSNHHLSPKLPATPDDGHKYYCSGDSSRSDEPTFHHGLEPEIKSKGSKQDPRIYDPLQLESGKSQDSMEGFFLQADSGSSSDNSQRSTSADPLDSRSHKKSTSNHHHRFGNGAPNWGNDRDPARDIRMNGIKELRKGLRSSLHNTQKIDKSEVANMNGIPDNSPEDPNLNIECSSESPLTYGGITARNAVAAAIEANLTKHEFHVVKGENSADEIPTYKIISFLNSRMGRSHFVREQEKYFYEHCKNKVPETYSRRAFEFMVNHKMSDHARMPPCPSPDHIFDFDKDYRRHNHRRQSEHLGKSLISNKAMTEEHHAKNSSTLSGSIQVPSMPKGTSDNSKCVSNAFAGSADVTSSKRQSESSVARKETVPSHKEYYQHAIEKNASESSKRKSEKSFPLEQPVQNTLEPARKVPKTASSHSNLQLQQTTDSGESHRKLPKTAGSYLGFEGNQTVNLNESSRKIPKTASTCPRLLLSHHSGHKSSSEGKTSCVVKILKSVPALEDPSHLNCHSSGFKPITMLDIVMNTNIKLVSPIVSPERVPVAPVSIPKEKRPKHRTKTGESPTLEPSKYDTCRLSPIVDVNRLSTSKDSSYVETHKLSTSMSSPSPELTRSGASKGSPNVDVKVPNPNGNYGPNTSKGASKEASKEKKPRQTKKKPEKGKLWTLSKKAFDHMRKRN